MPISTLALSAWAAPQGTYQVTGPVLELSDTKIVVQEGDEKMELARTPDTKVTNLRLGSPGALPIDGRPKPA